jgi:ribonucleotide reductase alpha subunit
MSGGSGSAGGFFLAASEDWSDPYAGLEWEKRSCEIKGNVSGSREIVVPKDWPQISAEMLASKYIRRAGVPAFAIRVPDLRIPEDLQRRIPAEESQEGAFRVGDGSGAENDARQVFDRMAGFWAYGTLLGGQFSWEDAIRLWQDARYSLARRMWAPNSPQWFNSGLNWAYGIKGAPAGSWTNGPHGLFQTDSGYEYPQIHACFIQGVQDNLVGPQGIMDLWRREAVVFKFGSGSGSNVSSIRGKGEPLSGGGKSSGLLSFLRIGDRAAGAIKSGGTCLAPHTWLYTEKGPRKAIDLVDKQFIVLSYHPPSRRYKAKRAEAFVSGRKRVVRVTTDKGSFDVSYDHPFRLSTGEYVEAEHLSVGLSLFACSVDMRNGYLRVHLRNGRKGRRFLHDLIAEDVMGEHLSFPERVVHHRDQDKQNCSPENLEVKSQSVHAGEHGLDLASKGEHVFQRQRFPKLGEKNPMHASGDFWRGPNAEAYRDGKSKELEARGRSEIGRMQSLAATQKMINLGYRLINQGKDISTFDRYLQARREVVGRIACARKVRRSIEERFGSYEGYLEVLVKENHRVISVETVGEMEVIDVRVFCDTPDTRDPGTGHNFVLWSSDSLTGSGVCVHNTRRAAKMVVCDMDHPDIEDFVQWKVKEEQKVAAMAVGSSLACEKLKAIADAPTGKIRLLATKAAIAAGIPSAMAEHARGLADAGMPMEFPQYSVGFEDEAYETVSGQNSNNSVRVSDAFLESVEHDRDWGLFARVDRERETKEPGFCAEPFRTVKARELWDKVARAAWLTADPGVQYDDLINEWHPCPEDGRQRASNPCCFVGDTCLDSVEGPARFDDLARRPVRELPSVNCLDEETDTCVVRPLKRVWKSGETDKLVLLKTRRGLAFRCTPDHPWKIRGGDYREAKDLKPGDELQGLCRMAVPGMDPGDSVASVEELLLPVPVAVYDAQVDDPKIHNFGVMPEGSAEPSSLVVHNSEYLYLDDTGCNLASLRLTAFLKPDGSFDVSMFRRVAEVATVVLDVTVDLASFPSREIAVGTARHRTLGLGYADLGTLLMRKGIPYDSPLARAWASSLTALLHFVAMVVSGRLASRSGPFPAWTSNASHCFRVLQNHEAALWPSKSFEGLKYPPERVDESLAPKDVLQAARSLAAESIRLAESHGLRNAQVTVIAPTGTIGLLMGCDTTGVEPDFSLVKHKTMVGGGYLKIVNESVRYSLQALGYSPEGIDTIMAHVGGSGTLNMPLGMDMVCRESLIHRGVALSAVDRIEKAIPGAVSLRGAVSTGLDIDPTGPDLLSSLGYSEKAILESEKAVLGHMTVEGAPGLLEAHYAVFDCANPCGDGKRFIAPEGHLHMLAAVQPFISGGISKTVNVPASATIDDIRTWYTQARKLGIKCLAIYRDGCKMSQPLSSGGGSREEVEEDTNNQEEAEIFLPPLTEGNGKLPSRGIAHDRGVRFPLPDRRAGHTQKARIGTQTVYIRTGEYEDGRLGEIFLECSKQGAPYRGLANAFAIAISIGLQYGVPLEEFLDAFCFTRFEPSGPVALHDRVKNCTSLVDYVMRHLGIFYLEREDLAHVPPVEAHEIPEPDNGQPILLAPEIRRPTASNGAPLSKMSEARKLGYEGEPCNVCGAWSLVRRGTCLCCDSCGTSTGCV